MVIESPDLGVFAEPAYIQEHPFEPYEKALRQRKADLIVFPKRVVPRLPSRFEEHYPALGMKEDGAVASYRDGRREHSVHAIEYPDRWAIHLDTANPRYAGKRLDHLVNDAPGVIFVFLVIIILLSSD